MKSDSIIKMAGDPRQVTYHTHFSDKYKKYSDGKIQEFVLNECKKINCNVDTETLKGSWRNNEIICDLANRIFPEYPQCESLQTEITGHDGVFLVRKKDIEHYLEKYNPLQLRLSKIVKVNADYEVMNFGESKGLTCDRVLIYPTKNILEWMLFNKKIDSFKTRCGFYVAVTRAKYSTAIVCQDTVRTDSLPIYQRV